MLPDLSAYVAPDICSGGEVRINFTIEDLCDTLTADGTFKLTAPDPVWASCSPENSSTSSASDACLTGEQLDIEFQAWKDGFSYGGGCEPLTTNWDELMALDWRNFGNMVDGYEVPFTLRVSDICSSDSATCTFTIPPCNPVCNTVYAFSNPEELEPGDAVADVKCFLNEGYSNWGWSNFIEQPEVGDTVYYMPLYAGNPDCSAITEPVGMVTITYTIGGTLTVDYDMHGDYYLTEAHVNVGCEWYAMKKNGSPTVAPGQYIHGDMMDMATSYSVDFADVSGDVWVIVHGVGCYIDGYTPDPMADSDSNNNTIACTASASVSPESESVTTLGLKSTNLKVYPNPFSETVTFEFKTHSNAHATLEISNLLGQKVATLLDGPVEKGVLNRIDYTPVYETPGMLIYRLTINQSVQTGRIIYKK
ncbi:hypothetical protein NC99_18300 [Sunxiuqinia dokdonensis]|uniref:Secretion system C-terminal sorting domain-containing protein n=2 Tax=Sunxiuqinia dokdonensis TaxID=1409788 RepID=A0A0L8VA77_9BACT|nr:hypothetical protein NC99_18300 [Sunxiuqinia dokdonensis]